MKHIRSFVLPALLAAAALPAHGQSLPNIASDIVSGLGAQGRLMWIDGTANVARTVTLNGVPVVIDYTTTIDGVRDIVQKCKAAHVNTLVVDVKPLSGQVLYKSQVAPRMTEWKGRPVPDFDVLAAFIAEGHKAGLQVDADINILSEGHKYFNVGPAYDHPEWQSVVYTIDRGMLANGARLSVRAPGEPDDPNKPALLSDRNTVMGSEPSAMVGLEGADPAASAVTEAVSTLGNQLNVVLDANNVVAGMVDSALLGDDPLIAPEDGHLVTVTREADRDWTAKNLSPGTPVRFDMRTSLVPIAQAPSEKVACFVNPLDPGARKHEMDIVREIVTNYDIDGLVLDRCRFSNLYNDFSDRTRSAFAHWVGKPITAWPQDVFAFPVTPGGKVKEGKLYRPWLEFRAEIIRDFTAEVARTARGIKPGIILGTYVGSWYPNYYEVGVNWGSEKTSLHYSWFTPNYPHTGYARFFDWVCTGCYYPVATEQDARDQGLSSRATVEFAAGLSCQAVANDAFVYAGIYVPDYAGKPDAMVRALTAAGSKSQGWMIFDVSQVNEFNLWPALDKAFTTDLPPPSQLPGLLSSLRDAVDASSPSR